MKTNTRYETPDALKHDAHTLAEDAKALLEATSNIADERVKEARERLEVALTRGKEALGEVQARARQGVIAADKVVRDHPYETIAVAFGLGAVLGYIVTRRD